MSFDQSKLILTLFHSFRCHSIHSDVIPSFYSHSVIHVSFDIIPVSFHGVTLPPPKKKKKKIVVSISFYSHSVIHVSFDVIPVSFHGVVLLLPQILKDFPASGG